MNKTQKFLLAAVAVAFSASTAAAVSSEYKGYIRNAFKNNNLADHVAGYLALQDAETCSVSWTIGLCASNKRDILFQEKDCSAAGNAGGIAANSVVNASTNQLTCYLAKNAKGSLPTNTVASTTIVAQGSGASVNIVTGAAWLEVASTNGVGGVTLTGTACGTNTSYFMACSAPSSGLSLVSPAIQF